MKLTIALVFLCFTSSAFSANSLTIYNIPSPQKFNWKNPNTAYWSMKANIRPQMPSTDSSGQVMPKLKARTIGHSYFRLTCEIQGKRHELINGMTMQGYPKDYMGEFFFFGGQGKYGYSILFNTFNGRLDIRPDVNEAKDKKSLLRDLEARKRIVTYPMYDGETKSIEPRAPLSFMIFELDESSCQNLMDYYHAFVAYGGDRQYGFMVHPLNPHGELNVGPEFGSGCTEFTTSFLQRAGLLSPEFKEAWLRHLYIPNALIGTTERPVNRSVMQSTQLPWGKVADSLHTYLGFWDPEMMHEWALKEHANPRLGRKPVVDGVAKGVFIPLRKSASNY